MAWYWSQDPSEYHSGDFASADEAFADACANCSPGDRVVLGADGPPVSLAGFVDSFAFERALEDWLSEELPDNGGAWEDEAEQAWAAVPQEAREDLLARLRRAAEEWHAAHGVALRSGIVEEREWRTVPEEPPAEEVLDA